MRWLRNRGQGIRYADDLPDWIAEYEATRTGEMRMANRMFRPKPLFYRRGEFGDDHRLKYLLMFLDVRDWRVLELGPLSCHHSIMLEKLGVRETVAVEGRESNYQNCLQVKEAYGLDRTILVSQNIEDLYEGHGSPLFEGRFDLVFCAGLFYHLPDPGKALSWLRQQSPRLFLATHYVEPAMERLYQPPMFVDRDYAFSGCVYRTKSFREGGLESALSGLSDFSTWLYEADLLELIRGAGYQTVEVLGKDVQSGLPHVTIMAE